MKCKQTKSIRRQGRRPTQPQPMASAMGPHALTDAKAEGRHNIAQIQYCVSLTCVGLRPKKNHNLSGLFVVSARNDAERPLRINAPVLSIDNALAMA